MAAVTTIPAKENKELSMIPVAAVEASAPAGMAAIERHPDWALLSRIPMRLSAAIPLRGLKVRDMVALKAGSLVMSDWICGEDVPLKIGDVQLCWSEFEVVEQRLAIRVTRLA